MKTKSPKASLFIALFVIFMDFVGFAIIWPIFSPMLFDASLPLLPSDTSPAVRGFWLGLLLSLAPLSQFFSSAVWGAISDNLGRKKPLQFSLMVTCLGSVCAFFGTYFYSLWIILLSRVIIGLASGNISIVQATIADISTPEEKTKNFGLFGMMIGLGFTVGPLIGGSFSYYGYSMPFVLAAFLAALNLIFCFWFFQETLHFPIKTKINWKAGLINFKKAFHLEGLRTVFLVSFLANFAWVFFVEFIPVYLISQFHFSSTNLGLFFGVASGIFALNSGVLIRLVSKYLSAETLLCGGLFLGGLSILSILLNDSLIWMWSLIVFMFSFCAYFSPSCNTLVSNRASPQTQGEALGVLGSLYAISTIASSLFSGSLVGAHPTLPIWGGGLIMVAAGIIFFALYPNFHLRQKISGLLSRSR
jgi:MFS transporter, DHA1 family, tetracycline resistance protein